MPERSLPSTSRYSSSCWYLPRSSRSCCWSSAFSSFSFLDCFLLLSRAMSRSCKRDCALWSSLDSLVISASLFSSRLPSWLTLPVGLN